MNQAHLDQFKVLVVEELNLTLVIRYVPTSPELAITLRNDFN